MLYDQSTRDAARRAADHFTAHPETQTTGVMARDFAGESINFDSPHAVCRCAIGQFAYELVGRTQQRRAATTIAGEAIGSTERDRVIGLNDTNKAYGIAALYLIAEGKLP